MGFQCVVMDVGQHFQPPVVFEVTPALHSSPSPALYNSSLNTERLQSKEIQRQYLHRNNGSSQSVGLKSHSLVYTM